MLVLCPFHASLELVVTVVIDFWACAWCNAVRTAKDLHGDEDELSFPPEFTERFFGEEGKIYGYKGLKVFYLPTLPLPALLGLLHSFFYFFSSDAGFNETWCLQIDVWLHAVSFYAHANIHYDVKLRVCLTRGLILSFCTCELTKLMVWMWKLSEIRKGFLASYKLSSNVHIWNLSAVYSWLWSKCN